MPPLFWIDIIGYCISTLITGSLTLMVIGVDPRSRVNRSFALFTGTMVIWMGAAILLRLSLWLESVLSSGDFFPNSHLWALIVIVLVIVTCSFMLLFSVTYLNSRTRLIDLEIIIGLSLSILFTIIIAVGTEGFIPKLFLAENGLINHESGAVSKIFAILINMFVFHAIMLFWRERHQPGNIYIIISMIFFTLGLLLKVFLEVTFPIFSFFITISSIILGYVVISKQLFNPLKERTIQLNNEIEERKQAEKETQRLRNYLANIIDSMPSILVGVDNKGRVTQWNNAVAKKTNVKPDDALRQPLEKLLPWMGREMDKVKKAISERTVQAESKVPRMESGKTRYEDVTVYPLTSNGVEGAVIRVDDITERVQIEEMMVQSEKMLSVGGLAAGMAHEINNPLGAILQASQNVRRRVSPELEVNIRTAQACGITMEALSHYLEEREILVFLDDIKKSGERAAEIVSNMLSFSRKPLSGESTVNLTDLLDKTLVLASSDYDLKKQYDFRKIEIVKDYELNVPPVVCQTSKIQQVLLNILRNGAEAMRETVNHTHEPQFILRIFAKEEMVCVEIEDNGPGMNEEIRRRVFEPFFTTKEPGDGTGLGMSVSYFIVTEEHKGSLEVESQPGAGTRFIIRLPIERKH